MFITLRVPKRAWRSTAARLISRVGDYVISTTLLHYWGDYWFLVIVAIASVFNVSSDYLLQKFWAFDQTKRKRRKFLREALLYGCIRAGVGLVGLMMVVFLYFINEIPYAISALLVAIPLWFASYPITKLLFVGSSRGLPVYFRRWWINVRKRVRS